MSTEVVIGVVSATVSVVGAVTAGLMTTWSAQRTRRYESLIEAQQKAESKAEQAEMMLSRYREPLLAAAQNLQSRVYNIVHDHYLAAYLHCGDPDQERYARDYTIYLLADYLCWVEIIRRDLRFLDPGSQEGNRELVRKLEATGGAISHEALARPLRLFHGEQRAIGELMMTPTGDPGSPRYEPEGYVRFCGRLDDDPAFAKWFQRLRSDVDEVASTAPAGQSRLIAVQNRLIDLIEFLDPDQLRLPSKYRERLAPPSEHAPSATTGWAGSGPR